MFTFMSRNSVKSIDVNEMDNLLGKVELIDTREPYKYKSGTGRYRGRLESRF